MNSDGLLVVLSGPSGVGKGTICHRLFQKYPDLAYSVSMTTRKPRSGEREGFDYYFVNQDYFQDMIEKGGFLEWAEVFGNYYGTPKSYVDQIRAKGQSVVLEIDILGGLQIKDKCPNGVFVFLLPPSLEELKKRITKRGTETVQDMEKRLDKAVAEIEVVYQYQYVIVNKDIEITADLIYSIIQAEKCRTDRVGQKLVREVIGNE